MTFGITVVFSVRHKKENATKNAAHQHVRMAAKYKCQCLETRNE
jgi:hypothetical protein